MNYWDTPDIQITLNKYVHPSMDTKRKQLEELSKFMVKFMVRNLEKQGIYRLLREFSQTNKIYEKYMQWNFNSMERTITIYTLHWQ